MTGNYFNELLKLTIMCATLEAEYIILSLIDIKFSNFKANPTQKTSKTTNYFSKTVLIIS